MSIVEVTEGIRPATPGDCRRICELVRELAVFERLEHLMEATPECFESSLFGPDAPARAFVGLVDGEIVAYAITFRTFSTFLGRHGTWLEDLYVSPAFRGTGIGKSLLQAVAKAALADGSARLEWAVLDWNENAIGFYERAGASLMQDWRICRMTGEPLRTFAEG